MILPTAAPLQQSPAASDELTVDRTTFRELEIFEAPAGARSVFMLLNRARTDGGSSALRARMRRPFSSAERIADVQSSLQFILANREPFSVLPNEGTITALRHYIHSGLPIITSETRIERFLEAVEVRFTEMDEYYRIRRGVEQSAHFVNSLHRLTQTLIAEKVNGELAELAADMQGIFNAMPASLLSFDETSESTFQKILALDRILRIEVRPSLDELQHAAFEIDALVGLADVVERFGWTFPEIVDDPSVLSADGLYHPFVNDAIPNSVSIDCPHRLLFLTGPNMAGKTTFLRAWGLSLYLAHLGMAVPARAFRFCPSQALYTALSLSDNLRAGISFFRAEALRIKDIVGAVVDGQKIVAIMDEPFMGTNLKDALDAASVVLRGLARAKAGHFIVSSHLIELGEVFGSGSNVEFYHFQAADQDGILSFDYALHPGVSDQRLGMRVLGQEGVIALVEKLTNHTGP